MERKVIPYGRQNITDEDILAVNETLRSDYLTQGPQIAEFEKNFSNYIGSSYAVAVSNGTAALHMCTMALGVKPGDKVITTPITFAASANCIRYCEGDVVFGDIDPETYLLDLDSVETLLKNAPKGEFKGVIPVQFAGRMVDMERLRKMADEHGLWIIEDACHAPGAYFVDSQGEKQLAGNGKFAEVSVFSFHPVKHIACGEGGMITTNDAELFKQLNRLRSHGITKGDDAYTNSFSFANGLEDVNSYPSWYMEMQQLGYNYRITDIQSALGNSQLKRADEGLKRRREIAKIYETAFQGKSFIKGQSGFVEGHAYHLYIVEVENRLGLFNHLRENKIFAQIHYIPCHLMPYYRELGWEEGDRPHSEQYYKNCISLPMYPTLTEEEQEYVIECIHEFYSK